MQLKDREAMRWHPSDQDVWAVQRMTTLTTRPSSMQSLHLRAGPGQLLRRSWEGNSGTAHVKARLRLVRNVVVHDREVSVLLDQRA